MPIVRAAFGRRWGFHGGLGDVPGLSRLHRGPPVLWSGISSTQRWRIGGLHLPHQGLVGQRRGPDSRHLLRLAATIRLAAPADADPGRPLHHRHPGAERGHPGQDSAAPPGLSLEPFHPAPALRRLVGASATPWCFTTLSFAGFEGGGDPWARRRCSPRRKHPHRHGRHGAAGGRLLRLRLLRPGHGPMGSTR